LPNLGRPVRESMYPQLRDDLLIRYAVGHRILRGSSGRAERTRTDILSGLLICVILVTLLSTGAIAIHIKGKETQEVTTNSYVVLVVGLVCGLSTRRLGSAPLRPEPVSRESRSEIEISGVETHGRNRAREPQVVRK
jgi:hypothetical protein